MKQGRYIRKSDIGDGKSWKGNIREELREGEMGTVLAAIYRIDWLLKDKNAAKEGFADTEGKVGIKAG